MPRHKVLKQISWLLLLLVLGGVVLTVGFIALRIRRMEAFRREHADVATRLRELVPEPDEPTTATAALATTPTSGTIDLAAHLDRIDSLFPGSSSPPEAPENPYFVTDLLDSESGRCPLFLPPGEPYFTPGPLGALTPTSITLRLIRDRVTLSRAYHLDINRPPARPPVTQTGDRATTDHVTSASQPANPAPLSPEDLEKCRRAFELTEELLACPRLRYPDFIHAGNMHWTTFDRFVPAAVLRPALSGDHAAVARRLANYLRIKRAVSLNDHIYLDIFRNRQNIFIILDSMNRLDTPALERLDRLLGQLNLDPSQLALLRQMRVMQFPDAILGKPRPLWDHDNPHPLDHFMVVLVDDGFRAIVTARMQPGLMAWARDDEDAYYAAMRFSGCTKWEKKMYLPVLMYQCPPKEEYASSFETLNDKTGFSRLLLAAIRYRRENGRDPAGLGDLLPLMPGANAFQPTADSAWLIDRPGELPVPLINSPWQPDAFTPGELPVPLINRLRQPDAFTQAVIRHWRERRALPHSVDDLRPYAASPDEAAAWRDRFAPYAARPLLCHIRRFRLHRETLLKPYSVPWRPFQNDPRDPVVKDPLDTQVDMSALDRQMESGAAGVDYVAVQILWPRPENIHWERIERLKQYLSPGSDGR